MLIVRDDTIFEWTRGDNIRWGSPQHALGFFADAYHLARIAIDRHHAWLSQDNAATSQVHQRIGGT